MSGHTCPTVVWHDRDGLIQFTDVSIARVSTKESLVPRCSWGVLGSWQYRSAGPPHWTTQRAIPGWTGSLPHSRKLHALPLHTPSGEAITRLMYAAARFTTKCSASSCNSSLVCLSVESGLPRQAPASASTFKLLFRPRAAVDQPSARRIRCANLHCCFHRSAWQRGRGEFMRQLLGESQ